MKFVTTLAVATILSASAIAPALATDVEGLTLEQRNTYLYTPDGTLRTVRQQVLHHAQPRAHTAAESFAQAPAETAAPAYDRLTDHLADY